MPSSSKFTPTADVLFEEDVANCIDAIVRVVDGILCGNAAGCNPSRLYTLRTVAHDLIAVYDLDEVIA